MSFYSFPGFYFLFGGNIRTKEKIKKKKRASHYFSIYNQTHEKTKSLLSRTFLSANQINESLSN